MSNASLLRFASRSSCASATVNCTSWPGLSSAARCRKSRAASILPCLAIAFAVRRRARIVEPPLARAGILLDELAEALRRIGSGALLQHLRLEYHRHAPLRTQLARAARGGDRRLVVVGGHRGLRYRDVRFGQLGVAV